MRLWSVHPRYLDRQGLTATWREALLAQKVLAGATRGYRHHPQLIRFRAADSAADDPGPGADLAADDAGGSPLPLQRIGAYLRAVADEAESRGYRFDRTRITAASAPVPPIEVTEGQLAHEWAHLRAKLATRSPAVLARWAKVLVPEVHPIFVVVPGPVADWEVVSR